MTSGDDTEDESTKKYVCKYCSNGFYDQEKLQLHISTSHEDQNSEDELVLITEFNKDELKILVNFCTEGILPLPLTKLQSDVPIQVSR